MAQGTRCTIDRSFDAEFLANCSASQDGTTRPWHAIECNCARNGSDSTGTRMTEQPLTRRSTHAGIDQKIVSIGFTTRKTNTPRVSRCPSRSACAKCLCGTTIDNARIHVNNA